MHSGKAGTAAEVVIERSLGGEGYALRADIADAFGSGRIGYLYAVLNWQAVGRFMSLKVR